MTLLQAPALDPTIQVPHQDLPLGVLASLDDKFGETMARAFEHIEERRFAAQNTCTITRPLTPEDLIDPEEIKPEPALLHDRRIVNDRGDVVNLEKGYFSGTPKPFNLEPGRHRGKPKEADIEQPGKWGRRAAKSLRWLGRQLKKVATYND